MGRLFGKGKRVFYEICEKAKNMDFECPDGPFRVAECFELTEYLVNFDASSETLNAERPTPFVMPSEKLKHRRSPWR